jgi:hypothetical protein
MSERKRSRAVPKCPRANSLWARSKDLSAAASSREGCLGGAGVGLDAGFAGAAFVVVWALNVFAGADFWGCGLASGRFVPDLAFAGAAARDFPPAGFAAFGFAAGRFVGLAVGRADFAFEVDFAGDAFRTGAFSATRLGFGWADLAVSLRPLAEDFDEALCGAGREAVLFAPLMTGSLMRSTRFSQIAST